MRFPPSFPDAGCESVFRKYFASVRTSTKPGKNMWDVKLDMKCIAIIVGKR